MKTTNIDIGKNSVGEYIYRWSCTKCEKRGLWLKDLNAVESNAKLHERSAHPEQAVA